MSLVKRLWLVVGLIALAAIVSAASINMLSAKRYLESEIKVKNLDTATALAMSISQNASDTMTAELLVSSQFDLGHYQRIDYLGPDGKLIVHRENVQRKSTAPQWFTHLVPIDPEPGIATLQVGWKQLGTIELQSDPSFAYDSLWRSAITLSQLFLAGFVLISILGTLFIRTIIRPLNSVVEQAEALAERRFIEIKPPGTLEFRLIVEAMNRFTGKIKNLLDDESSRLNKLKADHENDKLTGYMVRDVFLRKLAAEIESQDTHEEGLLLFVRVGNLEELNSEVGRLQTDYLLQNLTRQLRLALHDQPKAHFGRLNGSDFGILVPNQTDGPRLLQSIQSQIQLDEGGRLLKLSYGAASDGPHSKLTELLTVCDNSMIVATTEDLVNNRTTSTAPGRALSEWANILDAALQNKEFKLALFPVRGRDNAYLHTKAYARIHSSVAETVLVAGAFLPWARRLNLSALVDQEILSQAIAAVDSHGHDICINLGFESVCDERQVNRIAEQLRHHKEQARHLYLDIPEELAFAHPDEFQRFCKRILPTQCKIGVEYLDHHVGHLGQLHGLGLHYIKVSRFYVKDIAHDATTQTILRSLCTISHTMGLQVIAEGVTQIADVDLLFELGFDGVTGAAVV